MWDQTSLDSHSSANPISKELNASKNSQPCNTPNHSRKKYREAGESQPIKFHDTKAVTQMTSSTCSLQEESMKKIVNTSEYKVPWSTNRGSMDRKKAVNKQHYNPIPNIPSVSTTANEQYSQYSTSLGKGSHFSNEPWSNRNHSGSRDGTKEKLVNQMGKLEIQSHNVYTTNYSTYQLQSQPNIDTPMTPVTERRATVNQITIQAPRPREYPSAINQTMNRFVDHHSLNWRNQMGGSTPNLESSTDSSKSSNGIDFWTGAFKYFDQIRRKDKGFQMPDISKPPPNFLPDSAVFATRSVEVAVTQQPRHPSTLGVNPLFLPSGSVTNADWNPCSSPWIGRPSSWSTVSPTNPSLYNNSQSNRSPFFNELQNIRVAVKRIQLMPLERFGEDDEKELEAFERLEKHVNIVDFIGHERDDNFLYIALELCQCSLEQFITEERVAEGIIISRKEMLRQATRGLEYLHFRKIVHRDVKPSNILVGFPDNRGKLYIKLADFGFAKKMNQNDNVSMSDNYGSQGWMAPEIGKIILQNPRRDMDPDRPHVNANVDIFSLGCVFFYLLTDGVHPFGNHPFRDANIQRNEYSLEKFEQVTEYYSHRKVFYDLFPRMIHQNAQLRPTAAAILKHPFFWRPDKILDFITKAAKLVSFEDLQQCSHDIFNGRVEWVSQLQTLIQNETLQPEDGLHYDGSLVKDLLRFIADMKHNFYFKSQPLQQTMGQTAEEFCKNWMNTFPNLIYYTWISLYPYRHEPDFEDFYDNAFNYFADELNVI